MTEFFGGIDYARLAPTIPFKVIDFDGNFASVWGYGENIYLGLHTEGLPDSPIIIKTDRTGSIKTLLTRGEAQRLGGASVFEVVAILEAPDKTLFATTHPPMSIIRQKPGMPWESVLNTTFLTAYGMAIDWQGHLFFTARNHAGYLGNPVRRSIYRSTDGGDTWAEVYTEAADWIFGITCYRHRILAAGEDAIFRSTDHGASFTKITLPSGVYRNCIPFGFSKWFTIPEFRNAIVVSLDHGASWEEVANVLPDPAAFAVNNLSSSGGIIIGSPAFSPMISISQDEGATWQVIPTAIPQGRGCYLAGRTAFIGSITLSTNPFFGRPGIGKLAIIDLSELVPAQPQTFEMVSLSSLAAGATSAFTDCKPLLCNNKSIAITVEATYHASATSGIECYVYSSYDNSNYDTDDDRFATVIPSFAAGATRRRTEILSPSARVLKVKIRNLDVTHATGPLRVMATMRGG